jgi:hypothetical protein
MTYNSTLTSALVHFFAPCGLPCFLINGEEEILSPAAQYFLGPVLLPTILLLLLVGVGIHLQAIYSSMV